MFVLSNPSVADDLFMHGSKLSEFIQSDVPSNTLFIWIPNEYSEQYLNKRFLSFISPLFQSESTCEAFHVEISFIHMQINQNLRVNKTNFYIKSLVFGLTLKQTRNATR